MLFPRLGAAVAGAVMLLLLLVTGPGTSAASDREAVDPATIERGRALFLPDCAHCHGSEGEGTNRGPDIREEGAAGAHFQLSTGRMPIEDPETLPGRSEVAYTADEIDALVAFVASLGDGPPVPQVDLRTADLVQGEAIYRQNCIACHGPTGSGGALTAGSIAPSLHRSTPTQVAEALILGPGPMPRFTPSVIAEDDVASVVAYVQYLRDPRNEGGFPLWHVGPVAEGLIAWLVGMGALLAAIRLIGRAR